MQGFLSASASVDTRVARNFLAPEARGWRPFTKITVYDDSEVDISQVPADQVALRAPVRAVIDAEGVYQVAPTDTPLRVDFKLRRVDGEWRITNTPEGLLVSPTDQDRAYRSVNLYFADPTLNTLVPDPGRASHPRPVRDDPGRAAAGGSHEPASRRRARPASRAEPTCSGSVTIENGVAAVNLDRGPAGRGGAPAGHGRPTRRDARQLPDVSDVSVSVAGADLRSAGRHPTDAARRLG